MRLKTCICFCLFVEFNWEGSANIGATLFSLQNRLKLIAVKCCNLIIIVSSFTLVVTVFQFLKVFMMVH